MDDKSVPSPGPITVQPAPAVAGRPLNDWQVPLLSCCSPLDLTCLEGFFCPCFLYGKIVHRRTDPDLTNYGYFNAAVRATSPLLEQYNPKHKQTVLCPRPDGLLSPRMDPDPRKPPKTPRPVRY